MRQITDTISPREYETHTWEVQEREDIMNHERLLKEMELEVLKMEARFSVWLKLPLMLVKLPALMIMAIGYCITVGRGQEPSENFWRLMR